MPAKNNRIFPHPEHCKRLAFFSAFIGAMGLNTKSLAPILGVSGAAVSQWFLKDNISLRYIRTLFKELPKQKGHEHDHYQFRVFFQLKDQKRTIDYSQYVGPQGEPSSLMFVWGAMRSSGMKKKDIAERLGVPYAKLRWWLESDDIDTNDLYAIAEVLNAKLVFSIEPEHQDENDEFPSVQFSIKLDSRQNLVKEKGE